MTELGAGSSEPPTRLLIVDDNQLFRECLVAVLDDDAGLEVVGSTGEINRAVEFLETSKPQIVLIDVQLTNQSALRLATEISAKHPQIKALIIGLEESEADILRCIEAGASGYVLKEASLDDLRESISTLMHGGAPCSPRIAYQAFSRLAELSGQTWTRSAALGG